MGRSKTHGAMALVHSVKDLGNLQWRGDNETHTFRHLWESIATSMTGKLSEETLASILLEKLEQSNKLKDDIA